MGSRSVVPWALLLGAIANFLIAIWIIVYICFIYDKDKVYMTRYDRESNDTDMSGDSSGSSGTHYTKQSKASYLIAHLISPLINGLAYLLFWCTAADWVERHKN